MTCCQFCRTVLSHHEGSARETIAKRLLHMRYHTCKPHCLENFHPPLALPEEKCRCEGFLQEKRWRCRFCTQIAFNCLNKRGATFKKAWRYRQTVTTYATQEPTLENKPDEPGLKKMCCMMDCKERIWEDVENAAFLGFCARCSTVYKEKNMDVVRGLGEFEKKARLHQGF